MKFPVNLDDMIIEDLDEIGEMLDVVERHCIDQEQGSSEPLYLDNVEFEELIKDAQEKSKGVPIYSDGGFNQNLGLFMCYVDSKRAAYDHRNRGEINAALVIESDAKNVCKQMPDWMKW